MKIFLTRPLKAGVAIAALVLLTAANSTPAPQPAPAPAPQDTDYQKNTCEEPARDQSDEKRTKLIRGML